MFDLIRLKDRIGTPNMHILNISTQYLRNRYCNQIFNLKEKLQITCTKNFDLDFIMINIFILFFTKINANHFIYDERLVKHFLT